MLSRYASQMGPTPLVPVRLAEGQPAIWCKLEFLNPSGSTKDRIARFILEKAWRSGKLKCGDRVVEASSGSTSIALALACAQMGFKFLAVLPEGVSGERVLSIRAYGGEVVLSPKVDGIRGAIAAAETMGEEAGVFLPRQFKNMDNAEAHRLGTAREVLDQIPDGRVNGVVSGVGTGGTLVGLFEGFREAGNDCIPCHARPVNLKGTREVECCSFSARIPGVADDLSQIFVPEKLPGLRTIEINDDDAMSVTREIIRQGFPVGPSSGLNLLASLRLFEELNDPAAQIVTVFPDRMERYFTTELFAPFK